MATPKSLTSASTSPSPSSARSHHSINSSSSESTVTPTRVAASVSSFPSSAQIHNRVDPAGKKTTMSPTKGAASASSSPSSAQTHTKLDSAGKKTITSPTRIAASETLPPSCESTEGITDTSNSSEPAIEDISSIQCIQIALNSLVPALDAQWLNFLDSNTASALERRTLHRFLIPDAVLTFGLWREGEDVDIYFFTHDKQERWVEVVTEALGIEASKKDLVDLSKGTTINLCDDRVGRTAEGHRTLYSLLQFSAKARIILRYCRISPEWLGQTNLTTLFKEMNDLLPAWPADQPLQPYKQNYSDLRWLQNVAYIPSICEEIWCIWPLAQAWVDVNSLSAPDLVTADALFRLIYAAITMPQRRHDREPGEQGLIDMLSHLAETESLDSPLYDPVMASLQDEEMTLATLHTHLASLAPSPPAAEPSPPTPPGPSTPTPQGGAQGRFRTAASAIARLLHDPAHEGIEYDIGYLDRFAGMKWMALREWGNKASEEDDWIPEHRVRKIVRAADGKVVWDREERVDLTGSV